MSWQRVELVIEGGFAEALAEALEGAGAISTEISDADAGTAREGAVFAEPGAEPALWPRALVRALFDDGVEVRRAVDSALAASGAQPLAAASIDRLEDADWVALTQRQFEPLRIGKRLWIVPTWHAPPDPGALNLVLDPGVAFGTGSHPTTRLCLEWLEDHVGSADRVLDYGCGSGILAIAALRLGAHAAMAVDIDPLALESARYNARRNAVALQVADAHDALDADATITVANILANPLRMLAPIVASHTRIAGHIALAGILADQAPEVAAAYAPWAQMRIAARDDPWVLLVGRRAR
jgi:ribosomal protein L11 methyltransferase